MRASGDVYSNIPYIRSLHGVCQPCQMGKQRRVPFPKQASTRASMPLALVHTDLCGPMSQSSFAGASYMLVLVDDFSKFTWVFFLKLKSEALSLIQSWKVMVEKEKDTKVKMIRSDRGGEFVSHEFTRWCTSEGIQRQLTTPYTPSQNGVVERKNRTIMEMARSMLAHASLSRSYWAEACNTAVYIQNRSPTHALTDSTPFEAYFTRKPDVSHFRVFGCPAFVHVPAARRDKLDFKSERLIFLGYSKESDAYRLFDPTTRRTTVSKDVIFDESFLLTSEGASSRPLPTLPPPPPPPPSSSSSPVPTPEPLHTSPDHAPSDSEGDSLTDPAPVPKEKRVPGWLYSTVSSSGLMELPSTPHPGELRRSDRLKQKEVYDGNAFVNFSLMSQIQMSPDEPSSYKEAIQHDCWKRAMHSELDAIERNKTWMLVPRPKSRKIVSTKWIFKTKYKADGSLDKHKAQLVARGFTQRPGVDFDETYAPTARMTTIRTLFSLAAHHQWPLFQMDVKSAFLNGVLKNKVYVEQPPGFTVPDKEDWVYRLQKALYGLKQAGRQWYITLDQFLVKLGLRRTHSDANCYVLSDGSLVAIILVYLIFTGSWKSGLSL